MEIGVVAISSLVNFVIQVIRQSVKLKIEFKSFAREFFNFPFWAVLVVAAIIACVTFVRNTAVYRWYQQVRTPRRVVQQWRPTRQERQEPEVELTGERDISDVTPVTPREPWSSRPSDAAF